jgi:polyisoprenoid-binding protein YceI
MPTQLTPGPFTLDPDRSSVAFRHKTLWGLATVRGVFASVHGGGEVAADGTGHGTVVLDTASLDTKNAKRDTHLRSKDFFDSAAHPQITFEVARIVPTAEGAAQVEGELTVRDARGGLSFPARYETQGTDAVVLRGSVQIDRADFGMTWNQLGMIKGAATIELELRFSAAAR